MTDHTNRNAELRTMLSDRRRELQGDVQGRIREARNNRSNDGRDELEQTDAASQGEIDLMLLRMRTETLTRLNEAIARLDTGEYGLCVECDDEIAERRLRALPFAVRCRACEEGREQEQSRARQAADRRSSAGMFPS